MTHNIIRTFELQEENVFYMIDLTWLKYKYRSPSFVLIYRLERELLSWRLGELDIPFAEAQSITRMDD